MHRPCHRDGWCHPVCAVSERVRCVGLLGVVAEGVELAQGKLTVVPELAYLGVGLVTLGLQVGHGEKYRLESGWSHQVHRASTI